MHHCACGKNVIDGISGTVYEAAPWLPEGTPPDVVCYGCENEDELGAEDRRQEALIDAAIRAGHPV